MSGNLEIYAIFHFDLRKKKLFTLEMCKQFMRNIIKNLNKISIWLWVRPSSSTCVSNEKNLEIVSLKNINTIFGMLHFP